MTQESNLNDIPEEVEFVGPGQILSVARQKLGLSQQDVAERLNFRASLVSNIEKDVFDTSLPDTFNRGYLKNYAKLVEVKEQDILASYEALNVANKQGTKMQSFSKETEKQAQNSLLMWISYLILAILIGSSVVWWVQDAKNNSVTEPVATQSDTTAANEQDENLVLASEVKTTANDDQVIAPLNEQSSAQVKLEQDIEATNANKDDLKPVQTELERQGVSQAMSDKTPTDVTTNTEQTPSDQNSLDTAANITHVKFTFSGDCWVNIYDATGERVAWGIKKGGYVMDISGQAPFTVTLGKPELVSINYAGEAIDMSQFNRGNIAKFTLPLNADN